MKKTKPRFKSGDRVRVNYDISCDAYTIPAGTEVTIATCAPISRYCDINLDDGRWMDEVEPEAFTLVSK